MSLPQTSPEIRSFAPLAVAVFAAVVTLFAPQLLNDGDTWWHVGAGHWIFAHGYVPNADPFSFTAQGRPWQAHEWLSEILMAAAYNAGGWAGMMVLFGLATGSAAYIMVRWLTRHLGGVTLVVVVAVTLSCMSPSLLARPHLLVLPILTLWMVELLQARAENRAPHLAYALLMIPWANMHGSYVFAIFIAGAFGLEALVANWKDRWTVIRTWGLFGLAAFAATLVTPHGLEGLLFPFQVITMRGLQSIDEWKAANFTQLGPFEIALMATLFIGFYRGVKVPLFRLLLMILLLHMALQHIRHLMTLAMIAPFLLAQPIAEALGQRPNSARTPRFVWGLVAVAAIGLASARMAIPLVRGDRANSPVTALSHVPAAYRSQPVINEYSFGGILIFHGIRPYIDGRADMYGDDFLADFLQMIRPDVPRIQAAIERYDIRWTIFSTRNRTPAWLDTQPGWRRLYADRYAIVHIYEGPPRRRRATAAPQASTTPPLAAPAAGTNAPSSTNR